MRRRETSEPGASGEKEAAREHTRQQNDTRELQDLAAAYGPLMPAAFQGELAA
jgi:hypothetical protein